jgi:hypothetical protein
VTHRLAAVLALLALAFPAIANAAADPLEGLWRYQTVATPALHGQLRLTRRADIWRATLSGATARARAEGRQARLVFRDGGELRVYAAGGRVSAYWLQPAQSPGAGRPAGARQASATPVSLRSTGRSAWLGEVRPLASSFTLWLKVFRGEDGGLVAAFRNPEMNSIGGRAQFLVTREGETVRFAARPQSGRPSPSMSARLADGRLSIDWPEAGGRIALTHATAAQASAFYPRPQPSIRGRLAQRPMSMRPRRRSPTGGRSRAPARSASTRRRWRRSSATKRPPIRPPPGRR